VGVAGHDVGGVLSSYSVRVSTAALLTECSRPTCLGEVIESKRKEKTMHMHPNCTKALFPSHKRDASLEVVNVVCPCYVDDLECFQTQDFLMVS
jgi:hypothetical protein